jgi:dTDP-4-amino-4,6-dideoxygalactose transaminase
MLIEDASHALGAKYEDGSMVGNCSFSDVTVFSFHPVKGVSCGEGGVITTNSKAIYKKLLRLRSHGISKGNFDFPGSSLADDELLDTENALENGVLKPWYYEMQELGYNYRITDIQAALGESQLKKIDKFIKKRNEIVAFYDKKFELYGDFVNVTQLSGRNQSSHHLYVILIDFEYLGITRHSFMKKLINAGIGTQVHYIPIVEHFSRTASWVD